MEPMVSSSYGLGNLPKLSTSKELSRRDSLSSNRTRDSGYNSDFEVSRSPLDFIDSSQHILLSSLPPLPDTIFSNNVTLIKKTRACPDTSPPLRVQITSSPTGASISPPSKLHHIRHRKPSAPVNIQNQCHKVCPSGQDNGIEKWIKDNLPAHKRPDKRVSSIVSLSSASSCEMYTDTDMSDDEREMDMCAPRPALPTSTLRTIDIIMRKIELNLRFTAYTQCNGGRNSIASNSNGSSSQQSSRRASRATGKRKARSDDNFPPDDDQEEDSNKRRRGSLATIESSEPVTRFACPFYKHEPHRFRHRRTCPGPGWPTVHRMKEHLYRAHAQSIYCPRCYAMFDADTDLSNHLRSAQCHVSAPQPVEGIDRETLKALRKRSPANRLEEDKWRDVYHLLFPDVSLEDIPSPFYDADSPTEESRRFRRELLRRVQQELILSATRTAGPAEQSLLQQVADIVRRCETDLLNSFDSSSMPVPSLDSRRSSAAQTTSTPSRQPTPYNEPTYREDPDMLSPLRQHRQQPPPSNPVVVDDPSVWQHDQIAYQRAQPEHAQPVVFAPVYWEHFANRNEWDWNALIPPAEDSCGEENFAEFQGPMSLWTR